MDGRHPMQRSASGSHRGEEGGFAMIAALLVMVLVTGLASAAMLLSQMDLAVAGNYRAQRTAEVAVDGGLDMLKAMVYGNEGTLHLPLSIPTDGTAATWSTTVTYPATPAADPDASLTMTVKYKQEDAINYNTTEAYVDEVVRYGQDYKFAMATKPTGKQPVWTVTVVDTKTNMKIESDLISTIGFNTPAALYVKGKAHAQNYMYATEETVEVTSGAGTPALGTSAATAAAGISIESVEETTDVPVYTTLSLAAAAGATSITVASTTPTVTPSLPSTFPATGTLSIGDEGGVGFVNYTGKTGTTFTLSTPMPAAAPAGTVVSLMTGDSQFDACNSGTNGTTAETNITYVLGQNYLHQRVYKPSEVVAKRAAGKYNDARDMAHLLFGIGSRNADLDARYTAAGGGSAGAAAADSLFRFYVHCDDNCGSTNCASNYATARPAGYDNPVAYDNSTTPPTCSGVVCFNYTAPIPGTTPGCPAGMTAIECMMGTSFADLKALADRVLPSTVPDPETGDPAIPCTTTGSGSTCGTGWCNISISNGCNLSGHTLGTAADPRVIYFEGNTEIITTGGTQVNGYGILVINGDADIIGSFNWTGLMIVKGKLTFKPCQGGCGTARSGPDLSTRWNGFIMIGGDLDLWTYFGGSVILGYSSEELEAINQIISAAVPHKVLSWKRMYN